MTGIGLGLAGVTVLLACCSGGETDSPAPIEGGWQVLFANEDWYKTAAGKEKVFRGRLQAVKNAGGLSTLQRTSQYRLGDRTLYTGARKVKSLDALVGKDVEITGKAVDLELEGQSLKEVWPAKVRAVAPPPADPPGP